MKETFKKVGAALATVFALAGLNGCATNDCYTTVQGVQTRSNNGNMNSDWKGVEVMRTNCTYSGDTDPRAFKAPAHYEHMNKDRNAQGFKLWQ